MTGKFYSNRLKASKAYSEGLRALTLTTNASDASDAFDVSEGAYDQLVIDVGLAETALEEAQTALEEETESACPYYPNPEEAEADAWFLGNQKAITPGVNPYEPGDPHDAWDLGLAADASDANPYNPTTETALFDAWALGRLQGNPYELVAEADENAAWVEGNEATLDPPDPNPYDNSAQVIAWQEGFDETYPEAPPLPDNPYDAITEAVQHDAWDVGLASKGALGVLEDTVTEAELLLTNLNADLGTATTDLATKTELLARADDVVARAAMSNPHPSGTIEYTAWESGNGAGACSADGGGCDCTGV